MGVYKSALPSKGTKSYYIRCLSYPLFRCSRSQVRALPCYRMISRCYIIAVAAHLMAWAACIRSNINGLWSKEARGEPPGGLCDRAWKALPNTHTVFNNVFSRLSFIFSTLSNTFNYSKKAKSCDIKELAPSLKKFLGKTKNDFFEFSSLKKAEVDEKRHFDNLRNSPSFDFYYCSSFKKRKTIIAKRER